MTKPSQPLVIPFDGGLYAVIPIGISKDDFECLKKTLDLWEYRMVDKSKLTPQEVEMRKIFNACKVCGGMLGDPAFFDGDGCKCPLPELQGTDSK